jgi:hypothetical protein
MHPLPQRLTRATASLTRSPQAASRVAVARLVSHGGEALPALAVLAIGLVLRLALAALGWPATDSDEGTMGLMARHIAYRGEHPIFFYGQAYMGALEAYVAAAFFNLFGPSLLTLRLGTILVSTLFLGCMYLLTRLLYGRALALFTLLLLGIGTSEAVYRQLWAGGGYAETLLFGALAMLLASWLASREATPHARWRRMIAFAAWGLVVGLGLGSDLLVLPFALASFVLLAFFCRRELAGRGSLALVLGLMIGGFPLLLYAITSPAHDPFGGALGVHHAAGAWQGDIVSLLSGQVAGTLLVSLPIITGASALLPLARAETWPLVAEHGIRPLLLTGLRGLWSLGYLVLLALAVGAALRALRRTQPHDLGQAEARTMRAMQAARLALLAGGGMTLLLYASSPVSARAPHMVSRYLIGLLVASPAVLAPLWQRVRSSPPPRGAAASWTFFYPRLALGLICLAFVGGFANVLLGVPAARAANQQQMALIADLERLHATQIYSDYWTCDRIAFLSDERIICSALDPQLRPDLDRYPPYRLQVAASPRPPYVFPRGSAQAAAFEARIQAHRYRRLLLDGYLIYLPAGSSPQASARFGASVPAAILVSRYDIAV